VLFVDATNHGDHLDTIGRGREFVDEAGVADEPADARQQLDVLPLASGRGKEDKEEVHRVGLGWSKSQRRFSRGHQEERVLQTRDRGVGYGYPPPETGGV
jgi:hypothetical protein